MRQLLVGSQDAPPKLTFSVDEAAAAIGISSRLMRTLIARGELRAVRIGRRVLVSSATLEEFVRDHEAGTPE